MGAGHEARVTSATMPKIAKELTVAAVAKLREPGRYRVGGVQGLQLRVTDTGTRLWVYRVVVAGKRRDIGLGNLQDVTLSQARDAARDMGRSIRSGVDPKPAKAPVVAQSRNLFKIVAHDMIAAKKAEWRNEKHKAQWTNTLTTYAYPTLGEMDVSEIGLSHVLDVLKPIWTTKTETATRVRGRIESVLDYATVHNWRSGDNPARWKGLLDKVLPAPGKIAKAVHHPAMPIDDTPKFMQSLVSVIGSSSLALQLLILTATRSGEVRAARWEEFDLEEGVWTIPAERMKAKVEHRVPLSTQALHLLSVVPKIKDTEFLFTSPKGGCISDMAMTTLMRKRGLSYVPHGFRSTFRDWAGDHTQYPREVVEAALAHTIGNKVEAAYRRKDALERRRPLMQDWADFLAAISPAAKDQAQTSSTPPHSGQSSQPSVQDQS